MGKLSTIRNRWKEFSKVVDENLDYVNCVDSLSYDEIWSDYEEYCFYWENKPSTCSYLWYRLMPYRYIAKAFLCLFIGHRFKVAGFTDEEGMVYECCSRCGFEGRHFNLYK